MSDNWIRVIPAEPTWLPDPEHRAAALEAFSTLVPRAEEVEAIDHGRVEFIDQGGNFEGVRCPRCESVLSTVVPDIEEQDPDWLSSTLSGAYDADRGFRTLEVSTPCCGSTVNLNDLVWDWPAGFARFELSATNPNRGWLSPQELAHVESALGHSVRQILQHI